MMLVPRSQPTPEDRLRRICRDAVIKARGNTDRAYEIFGAAVLAANDVEIERELTKAFRSQALRAWIKPDPSSHTLSSRH